MLETLKTSENPALPESLLTLQHGAVVCFDFGVKRIGVAVGDWPLAQAHPLKKIQHEANAERFAHIAALIAEWRPVALVVGLPYAQDGSAHEMTARCTRFANQLRGRFGLPVYYAEECFSSCEASDRLRANGLRAKEAKAHLDSMAAQIILQTFFEQAAQTILVSTARPPHAESGTHS